MGAEKIVKYVLVLLKLLRLLEFGTCQVGTALFQSGREYEYGYSASLIAASNDYVSFASAVNFTGELHIQGGSSVLHVQLNNVQLGLSPTEEWQERNQNMSSQFQYKLRNTGLPAMQFSYLNGIIDSVLFNSQNPPWLNNILRGALSMLVYGGYDGANENVESDIFGDCPTTYSRCGNNFTKTKDLLGCSTQRNGSLRDFSLPQKAILKCTHTLQNSDITLVSCVERHLMTQSPLSQVVSVIQSNLRLLNISETKAVKSFKAVDVESDLLFAPEEASVAAVNATAAQEYFRQAIQTIISQMGNNSLAASALNPFLNLDITSLYTGQDSEGDAVLGVLETLLLDILGISLGGEISIVLNQALYIAAAQASGNLEHINDPLSNRIFEGLGTSTRFIASDRMIMAAFEAFRRYPCHPLLKEKAAEYLSDVAQSAPVRIAAYLASVGCLNAEDLPVIQSVIDGAQSIDEVGAFIVSHISNTLSRSNAESATKIGALLETIELREFQNSNSINKLLGLDSSTLSALSGVAGVSGLSLESNAMFAQDSLIPRCANSDFSINAFGQQYSLLGLGICAEDFDDIVVRLLGITVGAEVYPSTEQRMATESLFSLLETAFASFAETGSEQRIPLHAPFSFVNQQFFMPTISGMPIQIVQNGIADVFLRMTGESQPSRLKDGSAQLTANLLPMANTQLTSRFMVGSGPVQTGLEFDETLLSAAGNSFGIISDATGILLLPGLPLEEIPILDVQSSVSQINITGSSQESRRVISFYHKHT